MRVIVLCLVAAVLLCNDLVGATIQYPCPPFGLARLQHSTQCSKYIQCFNGFAVEKDCAPGFRYNYEKEECMDPELAPCTRDYDPCPLFNDPANLVFYNDDAYCERYYLCHNNKMVPFDCGPGLHWDVTNQYCAHPIDARCELFEVSCPPEGLHLFPNPFYCDRFYFCVAGEAFAATCPDGLLFDIIQESCYTAEDATCSPLIPTVSPPTTTSTTEGTTTTSTTTTSTTTTTTTSTTTTTMDPTDTTTPWEVEMFNCPSFAFSVHPHPIECTWFIICEDNFPRRGTCPIYTWYDDRFASCSAGLCENPIDPELPF